MLENRDLKLDLLALGLLALTIFLASSLLSYHPADPPSTLVYPEQTTTLNICGRSGALVSRVLFDALGLGAFYLLFSVAVVDSLLLARREIDQPLLRFAGWLLSLVGVTTLVAMAAPQFSPGPVIGSGGYLGAVGRALMERNFANVGAYILTLSMIVGGLLLCTDYLLVRLFALTVGSPARGLGRGLVRVTTAYTGFALRKVVPATKPKELKRDDLGIPIRIAGRGAEQKDADDDTDEQADETPAVESEAAESEESPAASPASPLRVHKPRKSHRDEVIEELDAATVTDGSPADYKLPSIDLLLEAETFCFDEQEKDVRRKATILEKTFTNFGFNVRVVEIQTGPVIAQFEVELEAGLRLSKITSLADDLAIALRVPSVRIVAPIPGKNTVGIEVPNTERQLVRLREVIEEANGKASKMRIPIFLGKDVAGNPMVIDLATLPHLLIAGRTGTGKSVCLNSMIVSMLMTRRPDEVRMLMIDPKMVELSPYKRLPHLMHPVVTDMRKAEAILGWAVEKMEERYQILARAGVRHITSYNQLGEEELMERMQPESDEDRRQIPTHMPFIVIIADEIADLMMTAAKEVETHIIRLAQKSRAVGIHLVLATQKPTVDVITGLIKSNLPARVAFQVASRTDSRVVLDEMGADKLLGNGDLLFLWPGTSTLIRGQGTYLSDDEINHVIEAVATTEPQFVKELVQLKTATADGSTGMALSDRDELYEAAIDIVIREGRGSVSLLQRALGIGYGRAARLIDYMAEDGFVGPYNGSQAREILMSVEDWEAMTNKGEGVSASASPPAKRTNRIRMEPPAAAPSAVPRLAAPEPVAKPDEEEDDEEEVCEEEYEEDDADEELEADEEEEDVDEADDEVSDNVEEEEYEYVDEEEQDVEDYVDEEEEEPNDADKYGKGRYKGEVA